IYIDKVNKSHTKDSAEENAWKYKQEKIEIPENLPSVKNIEMQLLTAISNDFSSYAKARSSISSEADGQKIKGEINDPIDVSNDQHTGLNSYVKDKIF